MLLFLQVFSSLNRAIILNFTKSDIIQVTFEVVKELWYEPALVEQEVQLALETRNRGLTPPL
jgi:hypothetical protein